MWPDNTIGEVYGYALPKEKAAVDYAALRAPDAVVIGLSANDFRGGIPDEAGWTQAYADFIARLRREHAPEAQVYLTPSVLMYEKDKLEAFRRYIDRILAIRAEAGDAKVAYLHLPVQDIGADGLGADWHPSVKTHRKNAALLAAALERDLGWKRVPEK
jgi:lysophospholipase L1-like esterase